MSPPPYDCRICRDIYYEAAHKGALLLSALEAPNNDQQIESADIAAYNIKEGDVEQRHLPNLNVLPHKVLRCWNVNITRLSFYDTYTKGCSEPITITNADARSGALFITELNRSRDQTPQEQQLHMSDLIWSAFEKDAIKQELPASNLRLVWVDQVVHIPTKIVA